MVAAKSGDPSSVVVLRRVPANEEPAKGQHWSEFIALWGDRGLEASVCNPDYSLFFAEAVSIIDEACDEFDPPS